MKIFKTLFVIALIIFANSCKKDENSSIGTFSNTDAICSEITVNGEYFKEIPLTTDNYIEVKVNVTTPGDYYINTNEVNGYKFSGEGEFTTAGEQTVKIYASGIPVNNQTDQFEITWGDEQCSFSITVTNDLSEGVASHIVITCAQKTNINDFYTYAISGTGDSLWAIPEKSYDVAIENDIVYLNLISGVCAVNINTGDEIWSNRTIEKDLKSFTLHNNVIYSGNYPGGLYAIDTSNGSILWEYLTSYNSTVNSEPTIKDNIIYFGADELYALNMDGTLKWKTDYLGSCNESSPLIVDNVIYIGANDSKLHAINIQDGTQIWETSVGTFDVNATMYDNKIYTDGYDAVHCIDASAGTIIWSYDISDYFKMIVSNDIVYFLHWLKVGFVNSSTGELILLKSASGSDTSPNIAGDVLYHFGNFGLIARNAITGEVIWLFEFFGERISTPIIYDTETKETFYPISSGNRQ